MSRLLRRQALSIFRAALAAADPVDAVLRHLRSRDFSRFRHIYVVGAGKAGRVDGDGRGARARTPHHGRPGEREVRQHRETRRIELNPCGHPMPDEAGVAGSTRIAEIAAQAGEGDLVLCLISGGASALLPLPAEPITLAEKQATTQLLLACGATIHEFNCVRKHLSRIKGGQLARLACARHGGSAAALRCDRRRSRRHRLRPHGARRVDLRRRARDSREVRRWSIACRPAVRERLEHGARGELPETPKPGDPLFRARAQCARGQQSTGARRRGAPRARAGLSHAGALERDSGRDARDRAHARRHRARNRVRRRGP